MLRQQLYRPTADKCVIVCGFKNFVLFNLINLLTLMSITFLIMLFIIWNYLLITIESTLKNSPPQEEALSNVENKDSEEDDVISSKDEEEIDVDSKVSRQTFYYTVYLSVRE